MNRLLTGLAVFVLGCLAASSAYATMSIDGAVSSATAVPIVLSTSLSNDLIIYHEENNNSQTNSSISDTAGLTWTLRARDTNGTQVMEEWQAVSTGVLTSDSISASTDTVARKTVFGVNGANLSSPFDANGSIPCTSTASTATTISCTISTNSAPAMIITYLRSNSTLGTLTSPSGFTLIVGAGAAEDHSYKNVSTTQSGLAVTYSWTSAGTASGLIVDVIRAAGSSGPSTGILDSGF